MPLVAGIAAAAVATAIAPAADPTPAPTAYTVRRGDTTYDIARRAGVPVGDVVAANALPGSGRYLKPGQRLVIPARGTATAPAARATAPAGSPTRPAPQATAPKAQPAAKAPAKARKAAKKAAPKAAKARRTTSGLAGEQAQVRAMIEQAAAEQGLDRNLALAIGLQESSWRHGVVSHAGAKGAMQVMPANEKWASQLAGRPLNLDDPKDNITAGVAILKQLQAEAGNDDEAIAGYYQGLPSVKKRGMYGETQRYVASVKAHRSRM